MLVNLAGRANPPEHVSSKPRLSWVHVVQSLVLVFCIVFCWLLFVFLFFQFLVIVFMRIKSFGVRLLITPLDIFL